MKLVKKQDIEAVKEKRKKLQNEGRQETQRSEEKETISQEKSMQHVRTESGSKDE